MGLDMYLSRKKYVGANYEFRNVKGTIDITIDGKKLPIDFNKVSQIEEAVGYWRKANAIHNWFVNNVQDGNDNCREYWVSVEKLQELLDLCKKVKDTAVIKEGQIQNGSTFKDGKLEPIMQEGRYIENTSEIEALLPAKEGFFFGSTAYDEWYIRDIEYTIQLLEGLLKEEKEHNKDGFYSDFYYRASW